MAVTMNEMNVEVQPPATAAPAAANNAPQKKPMDLGRALETMRERHHRLCAD